MATNFTDVYDKFFQLVVDSKLLVSPNLTQTEALLHGFLQQSIVEFHTCHTDLSVDEIAKQFVEDLSMYEQWILANYMTLVWIRKPLKTESNLREKIGHKDYQFYSPNNRLQQLREIKKDIENDVKNLVHNYQYGKDFVGF